MTNSRYFKAVLLAGFFVISIGGSRAEKWTFALYKNGESTPFNIGYVELVKTGSGYELVYGPPGANNNPCVFKPVKADVERVGGKIIITSYQSGEGCNTVRYTVTTDGAPGEIRVKSGDEWILPRKLVDRGLKFIE